MNIIGILAVIFLMAFMVESLVEYLFGQAFAHVPALQPHSWVLMYVAAIVGVVGAIIYQFDLFFLLGSYVGVSWPQLSAPTIFGMVLTGLAIGRGANFLHDLVSKFFKKPSDPEAVK